MFVEYITCFINTVPPSRYPTEFNFWQFYQDGEFYKVEKILQVVK